MALSLKPRAGDPPQGPPWDTPLSEAPLAFVDLEMTGLDPAKDRVLEICIERVVGGALVDRLESLVRPEDGQFGNEAVHGIDAASVAAAPTFEALAPRALALLDGAVLVAHAAPYDVAFLTAELGRLGRVVDLGYHLDTLTLSRRVFGFESHALAALARALRIETARAHRAADDVRVLRGIFEVLLGELSAKTARDLWHVKVGNRHARPAIVAALAARAGSPEPVRVRYRPSGKRPVDLMLVVKEVRTDLDPPRILGYLLPGRGRRELRADRILAVDPPVDGPLRQPGPGPKGSGHAPPSR